MDEACVGSGSAGNSGMQCFPNSSIAGMVLMTLLHGGQWVDSSPTVLRRKGPLFVRHQVRLVPWEPQMGRRVVLSANTHLLLASGP